LKKVHALALLLSISSCKSARLVDSSCECASGGGSARLELEPTELTVPVRMDVEPKSHALELDVDVRARAESAELALPVELKLAPQPTPMELPLRVAAQVPEEAIAIPAQVELESKRALEVEVELAAATSSRLEVPLHFRAADMDELELPLSLRVRTSTGGEPGGEPASLITSTFWPFVLGVLGLLLAGALGGLLHGIVRAIAGRLTRVEKKREVSTALYLWFFDGMYAAALVVPLVLIFRPEILAASNEALWLRYGALCFCCFIAGAWGARLIRIANALIEARLKRLVLDQRIGTSPPFSSNATKNAPP